MALRAISSHTQERITIAYKASAIADKAVAEGATKISIALESLAADGFEKSSDFISPTKVASSCSPEEWDALKAVVRSGMTKEDRALMDAPKGSLSPAKQNQRTKAHQKINSFIAIDQTRFKHLINYGLIPRCSASVSRVQGSSLGLIPFI